jgi:YD repeat-containing protein
MLKRKWFREQQKLVSQFETGSDSLTQTINFNYHDSSHFYKTYEQIVEADGNSVEIFYSRNPYQPGLLQTMLKYEDGELIAGEHLMHLGLLPVTFEKYNTELQAFEKKIEIQRDSYGNPEVVSKGVTAGSFTTNSLTVKRGEMDVILDRLVGGDFGPVSHYLYAYDSLHRVVAEIQGMTASQFQAVKSAAGFPAGFENETDFVLISQSLEQLYNSLEPGQTMTRFLYDPNHNSEFGPTQIIGPNGASVYYRYDDFGRLVRQLDTDENITNVFEYNLLNK